MRLQLEEAEPTFHLHQEANRIGEKFKVGARWICLMAATGAIRKISTSLPKNRAHGTFVRTRMLKKILKRFSKRINAEKCKN
ncbi:hypothetical protein TNCV_910511 [Trichonephila clavipes]|uniref:Uncharacterized protein n=1 Tax=Trichonephila clavipes TaxID=2585209 RepID=A0A8X7BDG1_TRICX|nr:hypothetical protein TNCV_910511 [Trichonephila clavipes]